MQLFQNLKLKKAKELLALLNLPVQRMVISDLNAMEIDADVNENDIIRVHKGDTATIEVDAYLTRKFRVVTEIANL